MTINQTKSTLTLLALGACIVLAACAEHGPTPIAYGEDVCEFCGMTIVERGFGTELVTTKGKIFKFDSIECLAAFDVTGTIAEADVHSRWVSDYNNAGILVNSAQATFIHSEQIRSPMAGGLCAVSGEDVAVRLRDAHGGRILPWNEVCAIVAKKWNVKPVSVS